MHKNLCMIALQCCYQLNFIKMRAELASLNHCAVLFLNRASNLCWYYSASFPQRKCKGPSIQYLRVS